MTRVDPEELRSAAERIVEGMGASSETATEVAAQLVRADLMGHASHGVRLLPIYAGFVEEGVLDPAATPTVERESGWYARLDGRRGFGQVAGKEAVERGIELSEGGMALIGLDDTTHIGRTGEFGERAAEAGRLFVALVSVPSENGVVAFPGSAQRRIGTNPICFAVPDFGTLEAPLVLDMATSQVAVGKVRKAAAAGEALDPEWATTGAGEPLTDPDAYVEGEGALLPLGGRTTGHKGFGLALMAELFAGIVAEGAVTGQDEPWEWGNRAAFFLADPLAFTTEAEVAARVEALAEYVRATEYSDAVGAGKSTHGGRAHLPGEPEHLRAEANRAEGVDVPDADLADIHALGAELGVADALPASWAGDG